MYCLKFARGSCFGAPLRRRASVGVQGIFRGSLRNNATSDRLRENNTLGCLRKRSDAIACWVNVRMSPRSRRIRVLTLLWISVLYHFTARLYQKWQTQHIAYETSRVLFTTEVQQRQLDYGSYNTEELLSGVLRPGNEPFLFDSYKVGVVVATAHTPFTSGRS